MRDFIDSIFYPVLSWFDAIIAQIRSLSVPLGQPIDLGYYFGYFSFLGPYWISFITTVCALGFIYLVAYVIVSNLGAIQKFKNLIKWW